MNKILQEAAIFKYDDEKDEISFHTSFKQTTNPALLNNLDTKKFDAERLRKLTTWDPSTGVDLDWISTCEI